MNRKFIPVYEPLLSGNEEKYLLDCVRTAWISSQGSYITKFEEGFCDYFNTPAALSTSNGTVALHLALLALGIGKGDEVIVPDLTFAASVNAIVYTGAKPVLVDIDKSTLNLNINEIEAKISSNTKAIMPVHLYGNPCDMNAIIKLAEKYDLLIIEDAAESFGAKYSNKYVGTFGHVSCFSFYGNKTITTGEGGMILFRDKKVAEKAKILRDHGQAEEKRYWHNEIGFNYRMTNMQAAIGLAQLEKADEIIEQKIRLAKNYISQLKDIPGIECIKTTKCGLNTYWLNTIIVDEDMYGHNRDQLAIHLKQHNIDSRPVFYPMHQMPPYIHYAKSDSFPVSEFISANGISLPSSLKVSESDVMYICKIIRNFARS